MTDQERSSSGPGLLDELPLEQLKDQAQKLLITILGRLTDSLTERVEEVADDLTDYAENGGPGLKAALGAATSLAGGQSPVKGALGGAFGGVKDTALGALGVGGGAGGNDGGGGKIKVTNIVEDIDVGVPLRVAYDQWTQFADFPSFMKKVESVEQESDEKLNWKAQVLWSHRTWEATIQEQVPDSHIVWQSKGEKGHVDGTVTFHELGPRLTRILLVLEYHPQGFFEQTGNIWRAQGRRARLELKHFRRLVMRETILNEDDLEGWRGEIRDSEVVKTHEHALQEEQEPEEGYESEYDDGEYAEEDDYDEEDYGDEQEREPEQELAGAAAGGDRA